MTTVEHGLNREFLQQHFVLGTCIYICFPFFLFLCVCSLHKAIVCMYITMHDDRVHVLCSRLEMKCSVLFYIDSTMFYIRRNSRCRLFSFCFLWFISLWFLDRTYACISHNGGCIPGSSTFSKTFCQNSVRVTCSLIHIRAAIVIVVDIDITCQVEVVLMSFKCSW